MTTKKTNPHGVPPAPKTSDNRHAELLAKLGGQGK